MFQFQSMRKSDQFQKAQFSMKKYFCNLFKIHPKKVTPTSQGTIPNTLKNVIMKDLNIAQRITLEQLINREIKRNQDKAKLFIASGVGHSLESHNVEVLTEILNTLKS